MQVDGTANILDRSSDDIDLPEQLDFVQGNLHRHAQLFVAAEEYSSKTCRDSIKSPPSAAAEGLTSTRPAIGHELSEIRPGA
jgi:hypothetical protein